MKYKFIRYFNLLVYSLEATLFIYKEKELINIRIKTIVDSIMKFIALIKYRNLIQIETAPINILEII